MRFLVDENISRKWVLMLKINGYEVEHWLDVGQRGATDLEIMNYARDNRAIVLTCDLDFGDILAASGSYTPSVLQLRPGKTPSGDLMFKVLAAINQHSNLLNSGSLMTVDLKRSRVRALPLTY